MLFRLKYYELLEMTAKETKQLFYFPWTFLQMLKTNNKNQSLGASVGMLVSLSLFLPETHKAKTV